MLVYNEGHSTYIGNTHPNETLCFKAIRSKEHVDFKLTLLLNGAEQTKYD